MTMLKVEPVSWQEQSQTLTDIRYRVFVYEQQVPVELEIDEHDSGAQHWLAWVDEVPVGTVRLLSDGTVGRMAVLADYRQQHIGRDMLDTVIASAKALKIPVLRLGAQQHAIGFYRKAGFKIYGDPFMDAGIPHVHMELRLSDEVPTRFEQQEEEDSLSARLLASSRNASRQLRIFSDSLGEVIYSDERLLEALSTLARRHRNSEVRILICDDRPLREVRHPLVELSRRLSAVEIRVARQELQQELRDYFLIADADEAVGYARHGQASLRRDKNPRAQAREYREDFERIWQLSRPSPWLKTLY